jgi:hypothetical protein
MLMSEIKRMAKLMRKKDRRERMERCLERMWGTTGDDDSDE